MTLPPIVVHADWGLGASKRWRATARLDPLNRYWIDAPEPVGDVAEFLHETRIEAGIRCALLGFDFPIGVPSAYALKTGCSDFLSFLRILGKLPFEQFFDVARTKEQISIHRPFYPQRPGSARFKHLIDGLQMSDANDLLRICERGTDSRGPASPLFWTLGAKQVGKAALSGWREVILPCLSDDEGAINVWPFDGELSALAECKGVVIVETYPAEACFQLGLSPPGRTWRKTNQADRTIQGQRTAVVMREAGVMMSDATLRAIDQGFGADSYGEDRFDAFIGLAAMLLVVMGLRSDGLPRDQSVSTIEGWILGQEPALHKLEQRAKKLV